MAQQVPTSQVAFMWTVRIWFRIARITNKAFHASGRQRRFVKSTSNAPAA
jgi:hypothetical protein